jgi:hypothetical protein
MLLWVLVRDTLTGSQPFVAPIQTSANQRLHRRSRLGGFEVVNHSRDRGEPNRSSHFGNRTMVNPYTPRTDSEPNIASVFETHQCLVASSVSASLATLSLAVYGFLTDDRFLSQLWWLAGQFISGIIVFFPVSLPLVIWFGVMLSLIPTRNEVVDRHRLLWLTFPALIPIVCLLWGVVFRNETQTIKTGWQSDAITVMLLAAIVLGVLAVIMNRGQRWLATASVCCILWLCLDAATLAGMSVTGDWI